ncbi:flavin reductase family protein [Nocardia sp. NPDC050799]|uniref:flavin reductase family protein n=1 Tax=Nocardia sp. NPDC050799 TaxID=3154842 RepID=UPI0033E70FC9
MLTQAAPAGSSDARFRDAMAAVCSPVAVVTTSDGDHVSGTTVSAFCSLSMDPPMILVSLDNSSRLLAEVRRNRHFGVNVLAADQGALARQFASKDSYKFEGVDFRLSGETPRLTGSAAWVKGILRGAYTDGDHTILIGLVTEADATAAPPLTYYRSHIRHARPGVAARLLTTGTSSRFPRSRVQTDRED